MIYTLCDDCGTVLDDDGERWSLDHEEALDADVDTVEGQLEREAASLRTAISEADHHFCSAVCLAAWATRRAAPDR